MDIDPAILNGDEPADIDGVNVYLARPSRIPPAKFFGREEEVEFCQVAWNTTPDGNELNNGDWLSFRLEGAPGVGKNEIAYEVARRLGRDTLFMLSGHEEFTPEDLILSLVPTEEGTAKFVFRASRLATALYLGEPFFLDEINRIPERALAPLSSLLDGRLELYSTLANVTIKPLEGREQAFRFCCALNPGVSDASSGVLPEYIDQRTRPAISIDQLELEYLLGIIRQTLHVSDDMVAAFRAWYDEFSAHSVSVRQIIGLVSLAQSYMDRRRDGDEELTAEEAMEKSAEMNIRKNEGES